MNTETMAQNLRIFWDLVEMSNHETATLSADVQATLDQFVAAIVGTMVEEGAEDEQAVAFLAGALQALDWVAAALEQGRTTLRPEPFAEWYVPHTVNTWIRAWALVGSEALGVETK